jgi:para-nitrobenzyl esterase
MKVCKVMDAQMRRRIVYGLMCLWLMALAACGGGGSDAPLAPLQSGVFIDSAVQGLTYSTPTVSGTTTATGTFQYRAGETVTFSIGNLTLGSAPGAAVLTPLSITSGAAAATEQIVHNKLILLQTLDEDGDLNNGIQINSATAAIVSSHAASIDFDQSTTTFRTSLTSLMTALNSASPAVFTDSFYRGARTVRTAAAALNHFTLSAQTPRVTVSTTYGQLRGYELNTTMWRWLGVPYAKPPVGNLRWKPPENPTAWSGIREAIEWGDQAPQPAAYSAYGLGGVSEDCLTLNITAPKGASNLPVIVWFHGGAFGILTGNTDSYNNPASLPSKGVILVTVNHRLGAFGYLASTWLSAEQGQSGNYGQMDLIKALEWIRDNIAAFGGNPNNVTISGQSGGGGKAILLMASPLATHLFHKVICQSGMAETANPVLNPSTRAAAEAKGDNLFSRLGVANLAAARAVPWSTIVNADLAAFGSSAWLRYTPNVDGYYLMDTMDHLLSQRMPSDVPLLAGANAADLIAGADLGRGISSQMPLRAANNFAPQYIYKWSYVPTGLPYGWGNLGVGAYHGLELVYVFNSPTSFITHYLMGLPLVNGTRPLNDSDIGANPALGQSAYYFQILMSTGYYNPSYFGSYQLVASSESATLTDNVMTIWTNFAKYGTPSASGIVNWPVYNTYSDAYVEIGSGGSFTVKTGIAAAFP